VYRVLTEPEAAGKVIVAKRVDPRRRQRAVFVVAVALLLVAGAALLWQSKMRTPTPAAEVASEEKPSMARPRPGKPSADMKLYLEYMQRLEFEKKQSEEARAKLASMEREKSAEYQQILEAERRLQEERKRIEAERERLEKEKQKLAYVPKTVTSARISLRSEPKLYTDKHIEQMLKKYNFYDRALNEHGSFANDFVDNGDGTITDRATGLMWEGGGSPSVRLFERSKFYVRKLNEDKFAGYSDWRLPTVEELASLLKKDDNNGIHIDPLFDKKQTSCWSSDNGPRSVRAGNPPQVWHVNFREGSLGLTQLHLPTLMTGPTYRYVRAVRSIVE